MRQVEDQVHDMAHLPWRSGACSPYAYDGEYTLVIGDLLLFSVGIIHLYTRFVKGA